MRTIVRLGIAMSMLVAGSACAAPDVPVEKAADPKVESIPGARTPMSVGNNWTEREAPGDAHVFLYGRHTASSSAMPAGIIGMSPSRAATMVPRPNGVATAMPDAAVDPAASDASPSKPAADR